VHEERGMRLRPVKGFVVGRQEQSAPVPQSAHCTS
jgi:hypothetical protein